MSSTNTSVDGKAILSKKTFLMDYSVSTIIKATPDKIWSILTNASEYTKWNSTIISIEGNIALDEKIKLYVKIAPKRAFPLKVTEFIPNKSMVWQDGNAIFRGVRTYTLSEKSNGITEFKMSEVFTGLMLPMIAGSLPDFRPSFEQLALDLKNEAEKK